MNKKRVGIKYCRGCNRSYERVERVEHVRSLIKDRFLFLPHDQQDLNETRRFNLREGITAKDDTLPKRFFDEPLGKDEKTIRREDLQKMLQDYYALRGWDSEGIPKL
jgi:hypothetical protein